MKYRGYSVLRDRSVLGQLNNNSLYERHISKLDNIYNTSSQRNSSLNNNIAQKMEKNNIQKRAASNYSSKSNPLLV